MDDVSEPGMNSGVDKVPDKKIFFVIGVFFGVLVLLGLTFFILAGMAKNGSSTASGLFTKNGSGGTTGKPTISPTAPTSVYPPPPKFQTQLWTMSLHVQPANIVTSQQYIFKQNYTSSEIRTFVQKLFNPQVFKTTNSQVLAYTLDPTTQDTQAIRFNPQSGAFSFTSTKGIALTQSGQAVTNDSIYDFLRSIDLYDSSMQVNAQYKNSTNPGLTYYEVHRDWRHLGMPVLSFVGLLNLPEGQGLDSLTLNSSAGAPLDSTITTSTDGKAGYQRLNDFNTITIIVNTISKKVIAVESNMRKIDESKTQTKNLIAYAEAEVKLKNNGYEIMFNSPAGGGIVPWSKMYPGNTADATNATVTDALYTYLEQPISVAQSVLKPYVLFKGYATLANGYRSDFVAAIPAEQTSVLGASTYSDSILAQQQQGNTIQPTVNPTIAVPVPTTAPECADPHLRIGPFDAALTLMGVTLVHAPYFEYDKWLDDHWGPSYREDNGGHGDWYYIPSENFNEAQLTTDLKKIKDNFTAFMNAIGYKGGEGFRVDEKTGNWSAVWDDVNHTWGDDRVNYNWSHRCPIRLTGHSPTLFLYGKPGQTVQIYPSQTLYVDPTLNLDHWTTTINGPFDLLVNNLKRSYLYYEYSGVNFSKPRLGWNVNRSQLDNFVEKIATQLGLNTTERDRLQVEITQGVTMINDVKFFIGLIDTQELNKKLPLKMNPTPEKVYRYHFYVSSGEGKVIAPKLTPLQRTQFMAVEVGVYVAQ